jgi:excisionase family DNA binding protein
MARQTTGGSTRLMTTADLAAYLSVPRSRVYDCYRVWGIPAYKVGQELRFRRQDIDAWLEVRREAGHAG